MLKIQTSEKLQTIVNELIDADPEVASDELAEICDSSCMNEPDSDTPSYRIFANGFELAASAQAGSEVWEVDDNENQITFFFLGTEDEVFAKLYALWDFSEEA